MPITKVTGNVIKNGTLLPDDFSQGKPLWNNTGYLSATKFLGSGAFLTGITSVDVQRSVINALTSTTFDTYISAVAFVGDGTGLTNIIRGLSVVPVTNNTFTVEPKHNNCIIVLNSLSTINVDINYSLLTDYRPGHLTSFIQTNAGRGRFVFPGIYNADSSFLTRKQYSVCHLLKYSNPANWTLYGDLTSTSLTSVSANITNVTFTDISGGFLSVIALSGNRKFSSGISSPSFVNSIPGYPKTGLFEIIDNNNTLTEIRQGAWQWFVLSADSNWYSAGYDIGINPASDQQGGSLGLNSTQSVTTFTRIPGNWSRIVPGYFITAGLSADNTTWYICGTNKFGELGLGDTNSRSTLTRIPGSWTRIVPGNTNTYGLSGGRWFATGMNDKDYANGGGALAQNDIRNRSTFTLIPGTYEEIWPKFYGAVALSANKVYVVGSNTYGETGLNQGQYDHKSVFTQVPGNWSRVDSAGSNANVFLLSADNVTWFGAGWNYYGQLGLGDTGTRSTYTQIPGTWTKIVASNYFTTFGLSGNRLFATGFGAYGGLGLGNTANVLTFTQITGVAI